MNRKQEEQLGEIHHSAMMIAAQAYLCVSNQRIGREWLLKIKHAHERMGLMIERLEEE